jgi:predicted HTH transcriptional regulator
MDLQELIARGRFLFARSSDRLRVFELVNGKQTAEQIARTLKRRPNHIYENLRLLEDAGLIQPKLDRNGTVKKIGRSTLYEKVPLARTVPITYFRGPAKIIAASSKPGRRASSGASPRKPPVLKVPSETEVLDICKRGEDQIYEFKGQGAEIRKITKEIAAMLNTRQGGLIFYGIDDDGTIQGADVTRQAFDQPLQNSVKNSISPAASVKLHAVSVIGNDILVIIVPPWNRRDVYEMDGRVHLRHGTNVFVARPEQTKKLHRGEYVI